MLRALLLVLLSQAMHPYWHVPLVKRIAAAIKRAIDKLRRKK